MANNIIDKIQISGQSYDVKDSSAATVVELTQQEYDDLPSSAKTGNTLFVITDAQAGDLTNYYTKTETNTLLGGKQDTLVSSQNIKTINNQSLLGSGNIDIQGGGGKAVTAGTNISVTTGTTADTISCKIPYSDVVYTKSDIILGKDMPSASDYERVYLGKRIAARANDSFSYSIGIGVPPSTNSSDYNELYGTQSIGIGGFKIGNGSQYANFVSGCVAIGYGAKTRIDNAVAIGKDTEASGTTKTNINNQLTIDTSNQVYISNSANTSTYCLQEKIENTEAALGGLKLVKLSQSEYDSLATKDNSTLYVIVN